MSRQVQVHLSMISSRAVRRAIVAAALLVCARTVARAEPPAVDVPSAQAPRVQPPSVIDENRPPYPSEALASGTRGDVAVTATIAASGEVSAVELASGIAPPLDRAALEAATH